MGVRLPPSIFQLAGGQGALTKFANVCYEGKGFSGMFGGGLLPYTAFTAEPSCT